MMMSYYGQLIEGTSKNCFESCVNPENSGSLGSTDKSCLDSCMKKFVDVHNVVVETYEKQAKLRSHPQ